MGVDELLRHLVEALEEVGVPYALGGSIASIAYGEPRATLDISGADIDLERVGEWIGRLDLADIWALVSDSAD